MVQCRYTRANAASVFVPHIRAVLARTLKLSVRDQIVLIMTPASRGIASLLLHQLFIYRKHRQKHLQRRDPC